MCYGTPPWHLTHVYLFPPTQQLETDHEIAAIYGNLRQSAIFCHILPTCFYYNICNIHNVHNFYRILLSLLNSAKFCQDYNLKPIPPRTCVNWVIKSIIYTLSSCFLISFPYIIFWFHHIVYIHSLIISTLLYIITTRTYFMTGSTGSFREFGGVLGIRVFSFLGHLSPIKENIRKC